ncbi:Lsr2 family DNA-binding protein [Nocardia carnea]|uniref:Lsr2 family DNA-binding protein n=1 Tax=Nocardia carnea TaxID=37328 RepID=UPI003D79755C
MVGAGTTDRPNLEGMSTVGVRTSGYREHTAATRDWARRNGYVVFSRGRIQAAPLRGWAIWSGHGTVMEPTKPQTRSPFFMGHSDREASGDRTHGDPTRRRPIAVRRYPETGAVVAFGRRSRRPRSWRGTAGPSCGGSISSTPSAC